MSIASSNSSESDLCTSDEWTVVTHGDGHEKQAFITTSRESKAQEDSRSDTKGDDEIQENESRSNSTVSSDWEPVKEAKLEDDCLSSGSSDIAVLGEGEDDEDETVKKQKEEKPRAPDDVLGLARVEELRDDVSDISSVRDELNSEVDFAPSSFRHYVHVPNNRVNLTLTVVAVLAVTAVLGLGVGNFIGWSCMQSVIIPSMNGHQSHHPKPEKYQGQTVSGTDQSSEQDLLSLARYLHRQLTMCNKHPHSKACLKDGEVWRRQFADLIASDSGVRIIQELHLEMPLPETPASDNSQQLRDLEEKLSLLSRQIENMQVYKAQEALTRNKVEVETQTEKPKENQKMDDNLYAALNEQMQLLHNQNQELHSMLQSLQNKENAMPQEKPELLKLREEVAQAVQENAKLKAMMDNIKTDREMDVRQQINELQMENQDLRVEIGRLRYSQSKQQEVVVPESEPAPKESKKTDGDRDAAKSLLSKWPEVNWTELVNQLGSTGQGKKLEELGEALSQLLRDLWELNASMFPNSNDQMMPEVEEREDLLKDIESLLVSKWKELQGIVSVSKGYVSHHAESMSRLLATSMSKVYKAGVKVLFGDPHRASPTVASVQPQLQKIMSKMGKVMVSLEEKWNKMKKRLGAEQQNMAQADEMDDMEIPVEEGEDDMDSTPQWMFQRAKDRNQIREPADSKFYEDWYLLRSKNRKRQRQEQEKQVPCKEKDPKKCKKNFKKQNVKLEESSDEGWEPDLPKHTFKDSRGY